jgi:hypothetical protein
VKAKTLLLFISFACAPAVYSFGQVNCTTSTKLVCEFPFTGQFLAENTVGSQVFLQQIGIAANPINISIATQLTQLPVPSASVGVVTIKQKGSDVGRPFDNLGPLLTDRPDTVGKWHIFAGFSYQHFNFNALDGYGFGSLPVGFAFPLANSQTLYGGETNSIGFHLDQYAGVATVGLTNRTDVSVVVPFNSIALSVKSSNFLSYFYNSATGQYINVSPSSTSLSTKGTASGIGDITVSLKQLLLGSEGSHTAVAAGFSARFPSGDALNYLGSGAFGGNLYGLFEYRWKVAPHLKLSYQWNNVSQLMNLSAAPDVRLPGGIQYDTGADVRITRPLTLAVDLLGNQFVNTPSFKLVNLPSPTPLVPGIPSTYVTVQSPINTYTTVNFSSGLKFSIKRHFLLYGNVLIQTNNVGLRSDPVPLFGIAYKQ